MVFCSIFGHREVEINQDILSLIKIHMEVLITKKNVNAFLFGSNSEFISLCYNLVCELKKKYKHIQIIFVPCKSETAFLQSEVESFSKEIFDFYNKHNVNVNKLTYDAFLYFNNRETAGKASYIKRNQFMIDLSEYCIFYYDKEYKPTTNNFNKPVFTNSGTKIAYEYAKKKNRQIVNFCVSDLYRL